MKVLTSTALEPLVGKKVEMAQRRFWMVLEGVPPVLHFRDAIRM